MKHRETLLALNSVYGSVLSQIEQIAYMQKDELLRKAVNRMREGQSSLREYLIRTESEECND